MYRDVVSVQHGAPERHQLGEDGGAALQQRLHQAQEVQVDHLRQNLQQSHYQGREREHFDLQNELGKWSGLVRHGGCCLI